MAEPKPRGIPEKSLQGSERRVPIKPFTGAVINGTFMAPRPELTDQDLARRREQSDHIRFHRS